MKSAVNVIYDMRKDTQIQELARLREKSYNNMVKSLTLAERKGIEVGEKRGISIGVKRGRQEGREEGISIGHAQAEQEFMTQLEALKAENARLKAQLQ